MASNMVGQFTPITIPCQFVSHLRHLLALAVVSISLAGVSSADEPTTTPSYAAWDIMDLQESLFEQDLKERTGFINVGTFLEDPIFMFMPIPAEHRVAESPAKVGSKPTADLLHRVLRYPYASTRTVESVVVYRGREDREGKCIQYAYQCTFTSGTTTKTYRIHIFPPAVFATLQIYADGLDEMKSAEDVKARIREIFKIEAKLIEGRRFVESPRTFAVRSEDKKWLFRGGKTTLVSKGDDPTTTVVNALVAVIEIP